MFLGLFPFPDAWQSVSLWRIRDKNPHAVLNAWGLASCVDELSMLRLESSHEGLLQVSKLITSNYYGDCAQNVSLIRVHPKHSFMAPPKKNKMVTTETMTCQLLTGNSNDSTGVGFTGFTFPLDDAHISSCAWKGGFVRAIGGINMSFIIGSYLELPPQVSISTSS